MRRERHQSHAATGGGWGEARAIGRTTPALADVTVRRPRCARCARTVKPSCLDEAVDAEAARRSASWVCDQCTRCDGCGANRSNQLSGHWLPKAAADLQTGWQSDAGRRLLCFGCSSGLRAGSAHSAPLRACARAASQATLHVTHAHASTAPTSPLAVSIGTAPLTAPLSARQAAGTQRRSIVSSPPTAASNAPSAPSGPPSRPTTRSGPTAGRCRRRRPRASAARVARASCPLSRIARTARRHVSTGSSR